MVACTNCSFEHVLSNPNSPEALAINAKSGMIGKGREGLATISAVMDLSPQLKNITYGNYNLKLPYVTIISSEKTFEVFARNIYPRKCNKVKSYQTQCSHVAFSKG